jgi:hypothetical protein
VLEAGVAVLEVDPDVLPLVDRQLAVEEDVELLERLLAVRVLVLVVLIHG